MRYTYINACSISGINIPPELEELELFSSASEKWVIARHPDSYLFRADQSMAIANLMLDRGFRGANGHETVEDAVSARIAKIQLERSKIAGSNLVLIFSATGEASLAIESVIYENKDVVVTMDAAEKTPMRIRHRQDVEAIKLAIAVEVDTTPSFDSLIESIYFTGDDGRTVYSYTLSASGEMQVSRLITSLNAKNIARRADKLAHDTQFASVQRLFAQMSNMKSDKLRMFIFGWTALEILVHKAFRTYVDQFLAPIAQAEPVKLREQFLRRLKEVMNDKYRLTDEFLVVTSVLFPDVPTDKVESDAALFEHLKTLRDDLLHGKAVEESSLPVHDLQALLQRYVLAHSA